MCTAKSQVIGKNRFAWQQVQFHSRVPKNEKLCPIKFRRSNHAPPCHITEKRRETGNKKNAIFSSLMAKLDSLEKAILISGIILMFWAPKIGYNLVKGSRQPPKRLLLKPKLPRLIRDASGKWGPDLECLTWDTNPSHENSRQRKRVIENRYEIGMKSGSFRGLLSSSFFDFNLKNGAQGGFKNMWLSRAKRLW